MQKLLFENSTATTEAYWPHKTQSKSSEKIFSASTIIRLRLTTLLTSHWKEATKAFQIISAYQLRATHLPMPVTIRLTVYLLYQSKLQFYSYILVPLGHDDFVSWLVSLCGTIVPPFLGRRGINRISEFIRLLKVFCKVRAPFSRFKKKLICNFS